VRVSRQAQQKGGGSEQPQAGRAQYRVGIRELRQHASVYVDLAEKGYTVEITNRGRPAARLIPAADPDNRSPLERLIAEGILGEPEDRGDVRDIEPLPPRPPGEPTLTEVFLQMREEERW
jgi:prevent-host-death family protein